MSWTIIILLIIIGLLLLVLEVLVIPGSTVVGILGFASMLFAVYKAFAVHGTMAGVITLGGTLAAAVIVLYFVLKAKTWNRFMLKDKISGKMNIIEEGKLIPGEEGVTVSRLNPMGKAMFGDEYYEVTTIGDFIDQDTPVVIIKMEQNKIFVKKKV
ncbi:MAG: NfeD family protein [Bacteroidales bacterium]